LPPTPKCTMAPKVATRFAMTHSPPTGFGKQPDGMDGRGLGRSSGAGPGDRASKGSDAKVRSGPAHRRCRKARAPTSSPKSRCGPAPQPNQPSRSLIAIAAAQWPHRERSTDPRAWLFARLSRRTVHFETTTTSDTRHRRSLGVHASGRETRLKARGRMLPLRARP
jgi:hypothetical protein